jgi:hypothetical protein
MGDDPTTSVVDRWGMTHDVPNLGIVDGSVFVTAGAVNPTSTICALALRTADHLVGRRGDVRPPVRTTHVAIPVPPARPAAVTPPAPPPLSATERHRLAALADALVPGDPRMPSASEAGIGGALVDWVLDARPDLAVALQRALAEPVDDASARLDTLRRTDRAVYYDLVLSVVAGYYHSAVVRELIGYPGQEARPLPALDYPEYVSEGLLDFMLEQSPS